MAGIKQITAKEKNKKKKRSLKEVESKLIKDYPFFKAIKPNEVFSFHSDYFQVDDHYATILTVFHKEGADDKLGYFWGINLIPRGLDQQVSVRKLQQVSRVAESWIEQHQTKAEGLQRANQNEAEVDGSLRNRAKYNKQERDLIQIANELMSGASYLRVSVRLLIKAPSLNELDDAVAKINREYKDRFDTVYATPYVGEQKYEVANLYRTVDRKLGKNFMFTSSELAGSYDLVTHGIEDLTGEYVGQMDGDVNNPAVLLNIDDYTSHVVIAGKNAGRTKSYREIAGGERGVNIWGAKLGMTALQNNKRVVHLVLNRSKIQNIGVDLSDITSVVDMNEGDINFLEMFGDASDELAIFPAHLNKLVLMAQQSYDASSSEKSIIDNELREIATNFYIDQGMWADNAQENRDLLRIVGLPHNEVPRLPIFVTYLKQMYHSLVNARNKDDRVLHAYKVLHGIFNDMLITNGSLFNTVTSSVVDEAAVGQRVIYDFSRIMKRGIGVAMAQFVNALGFAVSNLSEGDVVLLHGCDRLHPDVKGYVKTSFEHLQDDGVRVVYIYDDIDKMIADHDFNLFDRADYTILGNMADSTIRNYEKALVQSVPDDLKQLLTKKDATRYYLRRNFDNVVFDMDLSLGIIDD